MPEVPSPRQRRRGVSRRQIRRWLGSPARIVRLPPLGGLRSEGGRTLGERVDRARARASSLGLAAVLISVGVLLISEGEWPAGAAVVAAGALVLAGTGCLAWCRLEIRGVGRANKPLCQPAVLVDEDGMYLRGLMPRRIDWWMIRAVDRRPDLWTVRWQGGIVRFDPRMPQNRGLARALSEIQAARRAGQRLPGERDERDNQPSDAAISPVPITHDQSAIKLGLHRPE